MAWKCPTAGQKDSETRRIEADRLRNRNDATRRMYATAAWQRFRLDRLASNPLCQRIVKGEQCRFGATTVHHLISPREKPELFFDPKNVLCLCANCHPGGEAGTPDWVVGVDYVPSVIS